MSTPRLPWDDDVPEPVPAVHAAPPGESSVTRAVPPAEARPLPDVVARAARPGHITVAVHGASHVRLAAVHRHVLAHRTRGARVLAPSRSHADDVTRYVLADEPATVGVHRVGWLGHAVTLATPGLIARSLTPITRLGFDAVVARVVARARDGGVLTYFHDASRHPGFVSCLARTMLDVRLAGLAAAHLDDGTPRGRDLAWLVGDAVETLTSLGHADRAEILALATAAVRAGTAGDAHLPLALVDPPLSSRADVEFARALLEASEAALFTAPDGDPWATRLVDALAGTSLAVDERDHETTPLALRRAHRHLFDPSPIDIIDGDDGSVDVLSAPGEGRECVEAARVLLRHAEAGVPFDRMAVVMRAPELYASHLEVACRRAGVPAYFGRGTRRPDPAGRAFLALLTCAAEGLSARRFAEYLSLGQVPPEPGDAAAPPDDRATSSALAPDEAEALGLSASEETTPEGDPSEPEPSSSTRSPWRWEALLNDAQVIGGADRWHRRLTGHREELRLRAEAARADDPSSARHEAIARRIGWLDELLAFTDDVIGELSTWPAVDDWAGWLARLEAIAPRVLARPATVLATLSELKPLAGVVDVHLDEVCESLRDRLTQLSVAPPPYRFGRVFIGTPDQVRARTFDVVCVLGLAERVFPQRGRQDPLLLDAHRARLSPDLPIDDDRLVQERLQLRLAVGAASRALVASYASMDSAQARPRVPSFYAIDLHRAVTGRVPDYERLIRDAQQRSGARLAWPAPLDPTTAVDAAEHDLSVLQQYLRGAASDIEGRARYLFDLNPALRRALLARHDRLSRKWTASDGLVTSPASLTAHRLAARAYSASALQRFASCPYQFYLSTILRLEPREDAAPLTTLDPLTRGSMMHEMLADAMRALLDRDWLPLTDARLDEARGVIDAIVTRVAAAYEDRLVPPVQRVWADAVAALRRDMHEWLGGLTAPDEGWRPYGVEIGVGFSGGFGRDAGSNRQDAVLPNGTRLHGVIDLLERRGEEWRITDYKTGRHRLGDDVVVNGGRTLQPILYAMAVEAVFGGQVTASRLLYCTEEGGYEELPWPIAGPTGEGSRRAGLDVLAIVDHAIDNGRLPAAPAEEACRWCDFRPVCGPSAAMVARRKDPRPLEELQALRGKR